MTTKIHVVHSVEQQINARRWCMEKLGPEAVFSWTVSKDYPWYEFFVPGESKWVFLNEEDAVMFSLMWT